MSGTEGRRRGRLSSSGPYLAEVRGHVDTTYMGRLEVALIQNIPNIYKTTNYSQGNLYVVRYLSPFYGVTSYEFQGNDPTRFNDVQKSYGMWMIPPDIGTTVMVIFVDHDDSQGYWIGCVQDENQNHMVPGIAASSETFLTPEQRRHYGTDYLPVAETLKGNLGVRKPVHPFADRLRAQGLLTDTVRGVTSSGARREVPSQVFGISTPGPLDTSGPTNQIGHNKKQIVPVSRLGGSTFVMDDGDINGENELVRIRTRTGHQILLHNSQDLIYIANSGGTAWIELTSNGKIDVYAHDSVSIHTDADFNFRADRDVNIEAGRNLNISVGKAMTMQSTKYDLIVTGDGNLLFTGNVNQTVKNDFIFTAGASYNISAYGDYNVNSLASVNIQGRDGARLNSIHSKAGAPVITTAALPTALSKYTLPSTSPNASWTDSTGNLLKYNNGMITSIMQRVPMHEPWSQHENINSSSYSTFGTDSYSGTANESIPAPNGNQPDDWAKDTNFIDKVKLISTGLKCNYIDLLACMAFETGSTFNPAIRNSINATGLIQFLPSTANGLGTTVDYLASLTRTDQMDWVNKYFQKTKISSLSAPSLADLYMAILYPVAVGQPSDYVLFQSGTIQYTQNCGLDSSKKGYITVGDAAALVQTRVPYVTQQLANAGYTS
jgi:hypothetical protein